MVPERTGTAFWLANSAAYFVCKIINVLRYATCFVMHLDCFVVPCLYVFVTTLRNVCVLIGIMAERLW